MKWIFLVLSMTCVCKCFAKIDLDATKPLLIPVDHVTPQITQKDVGEIIPTDVDSTQSTGSMMSRIADRSFQYWYNNSGFKDSAVGRVAESTQEKLKTDVVVPSSSASGVTHKFSFKIEAFQALAKMEYTGWIKAMIDYNARAAQTDFSVSEKLFKDKDLVVSHSLSAREGMSSMGLRWSF